MRYFVTGGTGFIGSYLIRQLLDAGHDVVALVRNPAKAQQLKSLGVEIAVGDITERETLADPMQGTDGVFHIAAWYEIGKDGSRAEAINVGGTRNVLEIMKELGIKKGVYTSTLAINSDTGGDLVDEEYAYSGPHLSIYDQTKWRAHYEVAVPLIEQGLPLVIMMPGVVYGPGDTSQMGELLRQALAGKLVVLPGGRAGLCWSHVEDIAQAHLLAMEKGRVGETYIISGPCHTFREGFEITAKATGKRLRTLYLHPVLLKGMSRVMSIFERVLPVPPDFSAEAMRVAGGTTYYGNDKKAQQELGYAPRSLEDGVRDTFIIRD